MMRYGVMAVYGLSCGLFIEPLELALTIAALGGLVWSVVCAKKGW